MLFSYLNRGAKHTLIRNIFPLIALLGSLLAGQAATATLPSVADTTLIEIEPTNNLGAQLHFNAGTTLNYTRNHGLIRFTLTNDIPAGSRIKSAQLFLEVVGFPVDMPENDEFHLHRLLKPWGEGDKWTTNSPGRGVLATLDEATWLDRFALTTNSWTLPGAGPTNDYSPIVSAFQYVVQRDQSPYIFGNTPQFVADLQGWVDDPASNHGWLLKPRDESTPGTARRFGAHEDLLNAPRLEIEYVPPPEIVNARLNGSQFEFEFLAEANQAYAAEYKNTLSMTNGWTVFTNISPQPDTTVITISNSISAQRFFRVKTLE